LDDIQDRISASELASFFDKLADAAGRIALTHFRSSVDFERKQDLTPVTIADRAIEVELRRLIQSRFPDHGILGEETGSTPGDR
jgi:inositol-phosphate phosphatase / L-galactose 1-phosphate phosphatase / histidinol-phosphatase